MCCGSKQLFDFTWITGSILVFNLYCRKSIQSRFSETGVLAYKDIMTANEKVAYIQGQMEISSDHCVDSSLQAFAYEEREVNAASLPSSDVIVEAYETLRQREGSDTEDSDDSFLQGLSDIDSVAGRASSTEVEYSAPRGGCRTAASAAERFGLESTRSAYDGRKNKRKRSFTNVKSSYRLRSSTICEIQRSHSNVSHQSLSMSPIEDVHTRERRAADDPNAVEDGDDANDPDGNQISNAPTGQHCRFRFECIPQIIARIRNLDSTNLELYHATSSLNRLLSCKS